MTMVEKVARAIYTGTPRNKPYDQLSRYQRDQREAEARAAIAAMREPTRAMLNASVLWDDNKGRQPSVIASLEKHRAMIDAALQEDT